MKPRQIDTNRRIELTGPWAGFGFQNGEFWTPDNGSFRPHHFTWPSLTRNIVDDWRELMAVARDQRRPASNAQIVYLRDVLAGARKRLEAAAG